MFTFSNPLSLATEGKVAFLNKAYYFYPFLALGTRGVLSKQASFLYKLCIYSAEIYKKPSLTTRMSLNPCLNYIETKKVDFNYISFIEPTLLIETKKQPEITLDEKIKTSLITLPINTPKLSIQAESCDCNTN